jgi:protein SCO1/2
MNRKALIGVLLALLIPIAGYLVMKNVSRNIQVMPRHYIYDSVVMKTRNGKDFEDTVWHKIPNFSLTNQLGQQVTLDSLAGKVIIADFFFTRCPSICPGMTVNMKRLRDGIHSADRLGNREANFVQFLSFSIDPERDKVQDLKRWADRFEINPQNWWLLTGDRQQIYDLSIKDMKLNAISGGTVDTSFIHTDLFVLIDKRRNIRGYYHGLDTADLGRLSRDVILLSLEKDPDRPFFLAGKLELIAIVFGAVILGLILLFIFLKKENKHHEPGTSKKRQQSETVDL